MGKKVYLLLVFMMVVAMFAACTPEQNMASTQPSSSEHTLQAEKATEEIAISENDLMCFASEEDFIRHIQSGEKNDDIAKTNELQEYYVLKNIPSDYELYKITAGVCDIGFWYLPSSRLSSDASVREAESAQEYYLFISPRTELNFSEVLLQHGMSEDNLLANRYYYKEEPNPKVIWEYDGRVMILYLPQNQEPVNSENVKSLCELSKKLS